MFHASRCAIASTSYAAATLTGWLFLWLLLGLCPFTLGADQAPNSRNQVEFNRDIRPLLADACFACHGPDKQQRKADLRLDTEAGLVGTEETEGAVIPFKVDESLLWKRILSEDPEERMPPPEFGKEISEQDRARIKSWIEQGAKWQGHWAFEPISSPLDSTAKGSTVTRHIDEFIANARAREGFNQGPRADPRTLVRRLSFDLLGLPPQSAWVTQFQSEPSDERYEQLVDQMIASPHFGERMAVWWLDLVRYADSVGYHGDQPVQVAPFRDYVIRAFNSNKPFDQFTIEQLAGDLLPDATTEQLVASGYNRLGMMSAEGGVQPKEYLAKYIAERVRGVSGAWLGITMGCCECHDHKYDPLTAKDFYQFEAFFADIEERGLYDGNNKTQPWGPQIQVPNDDQKQKREQLVKQIAELQRTLDTPTDSLAAAQNQWESEQQPWSVVLFESMESAAGVQLKRLDDHSILASGKNPDTDVYTLIGPLPLTHATAIRIEVLPDESLPRKGPGRSGNGNFVLSEVEVYQQGMDEVGERISYKLQNASATFEQTGAAGGNPYGKWAVAAAIDADEKGAKWGWAVMERVGQPNVAVFELAADQTLDPTLPIEIVLKQNHDNPKHTIGRFRISMTDVPRPVRADQATPPEIAELLSIPVEKRDEKQAAKIAKHYRSIAPELKPTRDELQHSTKELEQLDAIIPTTLITKQTKPRTIRVLKRGNWMDETGEIVEPAIPSLFQSVSASTRTESKERLNRLDLAQWIVSRDNPLTARTTVNRLWKLFFGAGLSRKLDDLGAQGEWPSHPELLDTLAYDFMQSGWDVKRLVKQLVMSETYRQSSIADELAIEKDPYNRWLSHQSRWRLDAEFVRDNALSVSGLLVSELGGSSVKPYQPPGYWAYLNFPQREWQNGRGNELYRRGVYTHWQRQYLHPSLLAFDAPSREECTADRSRSNTPLQALVLLNDPIYVEAARTLAEQVLRSEVTKDHDEARIRWAMQQVLMRDPRPDEQVLLLRLLHKHRDELKQDAASADALLGIGERKFDTSIDRIELAAWTSVARVLLNLHETITRY